MCVCYGVGAGLDESAYLLRLPPCTNIDAQEKLYLSVKIRKTALDHEYIYFGVETGGSTEKVNYQEVASTSIHVLHKCQYK